jgi:hypothetical protein
MHYRCAHCYTPLEIVGGEVTHCPDHPDGGVEWAPDEEPTDGLQ